MAIDDLLDEHEQGERVRSWLRRNGGALVVGVVLGLGAIGGWRWWQDHQLQQRMAEGERYQQAREAIEAGDLEAAAPRVAALDGRLYPALAAMKLARAQYDAGDRDGAIATLEAVDGAEPALAQVVSWRLARLLIDAGRADEAGGLLGDSDAPAAMELRGDAAFELGRRDEAATHYRQALAALEPDAPQRGLLELKLSSVGGMPAGGASEDPVQD